MAQLLYSPSSLEGYWNNQPVPVYPDQFEPVAVGWFRQDATAHQRNLRAVGANALVSPLSFQPSVDTGVLRFWGGIHNGPNAGNLTLQWAQRVATAVNTKVLAGSYIKYMLET